MTDAWLEFPSENAAPEQARPRITLADRPGHSLVSGTAADSSSAFSPQVQPLRSDVSPGASRTEAPRPTEASRSDGGYSEFIRILGRGDV